LTRAVIAAIAACALIVALPAQAAPAGKTSAATARTAAARAASPPPSLGPHASLLEGTWEFRSLTAPGGTKLSEPQASGVIVIDRGVVLAASYVQASPERKVGSVWEGRMILGADRFEVIPEKGVRYDSAASQQVTTSIPPRSSGRLERLDGEVGGVRLVREDGGTVTFEEGGRRVQRDPDGTTIVHERTSLVPRIPEDLPGRRP
jgi:hypothetical protein